MFVERSTPKLAVTPDAMDAHVQTERGATTTRKLLQERSAEVGAYKKNPGDRITSNVLVRPASTNELFTATNGEHDILFDESTQHKDNARVVQTLLGSNVTQLITADAHLASVAKHAGIRTVVTPASRSLVSSRPSTDSNLSTLTGHFAHPLLSHQSMDSVAGGLHSRRNSDASMKSMDLDVSPPPSPGRHVPIGIAFTPRTLEMEAPEARAAQFSAEKLRTDATLHNTMRALAQHAAQKMVRSGRTGNDERAYHVKLVSNDADHGSKADAAKAAIARGIQVDQHVHTTSRDGVMTELRAREPDIFLTSKLAFAKQLLQHGILAGRPTRQPLESRNISAGGNLTWIEDFDAVAARPDLEHLIKDRTAKLGANGHGIALAEESQLGHIPAKPGPALGLAVKVADMEVGSQGTGDKVEFLTSRPHPAAVRAFTTAKHNNLDIGITTVGDGSKGDQLAKINAKSVLLDDSHFKIVDAEKKGNAAIEIPVLDTLAEYKTFEKFGNPVRQQ